MATIRTMCPMNCHPTLCGMLVTVEDGRLVEVAGDPDNPDSRGFLCVRGHASREIIGNPQRLLTPLARDRRDAPFREVTWDAALDRIAERHAVGRARGGRALVGPRLLRQQLRHPRQLGAAPPLRQSLGLPVVGAHHDLLGARRLRDRPHRSARDQHQGGHGRPRGADRAMGRQPREPAEHRPASGRGAPPRRPRGHHRRAAHRGGRAVGRGADHPARHRRGAGPRHDARADRGGSLRSRVRRAAHRRASRRSPSTCGGTRPRGPPRSPASTRRSSWASRAATRPRGRP